MGTLVAPGAGEWSVPLTGRWRSIEKVAGAGADGEADLTFRLKVALRSPLIPVRRKSPCGHDDPSTWPACATISLILCYRERTVEPLKEGFPMAQVQEFMVSCGTAKVPAH